MKVCFLCILLDPLFLGVATHRCTASRLTRIPFILRHLQSFPLQYSLLLFNGVVFLYIIANPPPSISGAQSPALEIAALAATLCWHAFLIFVAHVRLIFSAMFLIHGLH